MENAEEREAHRTALHFYCIAVAVLCLIKL